MKRHIPAQLKWVLLVIALQSSILCIGIRRDYLLKHEDNGELYASIARAHLVLGISETKCHDVFYYPKEGKKVFYAHHPPGIGLILSFAYWLSKSDGVVITRLTAILFHILSNLMLMNLLWKLKIPPSQIILGGLLFSVLPMSGFFGRMMNHEIISLPPLIGLVTCHISYFKERKTSWLWGAIFFSFWGAMSAWGFFFGLFSCFIHAVILSLKGKNRMRKLAVMYIITGLSLFLIDILHIAWVSNWDITGIKNAFLIRAGRDNVAKGISPLRWLGVQIDVFRRYFTHMALISFLLYFVNFFRRIRSLDLKGQTAGIFFTGAALYMVTFSHGAWYHHYWQFYFIPFVILTLLFLWDTLWKMKPFHPKRTTLFLICFLLDIAITSTVTLHHRHTKIEPYCVNRVKQIRTNYLGPGSISDH